MRWRLGRSGATACFNRTPPAQAHVVDTSTEAANPANAPAGVCSHRTEGSSESTATGAIETRGDIGDEFVYVTADSCPPSGGRPGNDETTSGLSGPWRVRDSLTLSVISFVENLRPRPRSRAFISHDSERMPSSIGTGHASGDDANRKCGGQGAASALVGTVLPSGGRKNDGNEQAAAIGALSSSSTPGYVNGRKEDPLILELYDHIFGRGMVVGDCAVLGSARACLDLMLSREMTMEAMEKTGPTELISVATANLDLSASVVIFLLDELVDSESTAFRLADSHLLRSSNAAAASIRQVCIKESDGSAAPAHSRQNAGTKTTVLARPVAEAAEAALALSEACRAWRGTIEAANSMTKKASFCGPRLEKAEAEGLVPAGLKMAGTEHPSSSTPSLRSLESPKGRHHSRTAGWSASSATISGAVELPQEPDEQRRPSDHVRSAVRMVTSGAKDCYGQLVVLGYKEFTVRDSTWHRVGPRNARFILGRRRSPNGVQIGRRDVGGTGEVWSGDGAGSGSSGIRAFEASTGVCRPMRRRKMLAGCQSTSREKPTQHDDGDDTRNGDGDDATFGMGVGHGDQAAFRTPDTTPNRLSEARGRERLPHRARDACGRTTKIDSATANKTGKKRGNGKDDGNRRERGERIKLSSDPRGGKPVAIAEQAGAFYQVQLSLSPEHREAAENAEGQKCASKAQAAGERRKDIVEIPCVADEAFDMYQLGRMQVPQNDFVVKGPLHKSQPGGKVCGPVSRYAARLLVGRSDPHRCTIFAGGFNSRGCLTLPKSSPKWMKENGDWDAVTPFGVRIFKPEIGEWREVTVTGDMRRPRVGRLDTVGDLVAGESNELTSGTVVDVGGVQMLYESAKSMARLGGVQPSRVIEILNDRKPQCPVQLQTLRFKPLQSAPTRATTLLSEPAGGANGGDAATPSGGGSDVPDGIVVAGTRGDAMTTVAEAARASYAVVGVDGEDEGESTDAEVGGNADIEAKASVPHIFPACGHVHGYAKQLAFGPCPMCRAPGPLVEILFGWCQAIDREVPTVVFNPCGHAASLEVAERWSRLAMPNNAPPDAVYRPICPYCAKPLQCKNGERPYTKMIFAQ